MLEIFFPWIILAYQSLCSAKTVYFRVDLSWGEASPEGHTRNQILINGTSPGPALLLDQGDIVSLYNLNDSTILVSLPPSILISKLVSCREQPAEQHNHPLSWHNAVEDTVVRWCTWDITKAHSPRRSVSISMDCGWIRNCRTLQRRNSA